MALDLDRLLAIKRIIIHANCADGMASAMILHHCRPQADVEFIKYDSADHKGLEPSEGTIFADFSPYYPKEPGENATDEQRAEYDRLLAEHEPKIRQWIEMNTIVLDHHETQKPLVERFGQLGVFADVKDEPGVSGATLAYREVWLPIMRARYGAYFNGMRQNRIVEELATLAGIRDTWQREHPRFVEACKQSEALHFWPWKHLEHHDPVNWPDKLVIGEIEYEKKQDRARECAENGVRFITPKGTRCVVFQGVRPTSDAAEIIHEDADLVVGFAIFKHDDGHPVIRLSCRSHTNFDCGAFAKSFQGGGGHLRASGCHVPLEVHSPQPFTLIEDLVRKFEAGTFEAETLEG